MAFILILLTYFTGGLHWNRPVNFEDPSFNSDSYVAGQQNNTYMRMPNHNIAPAGMGDALALDFNNDGLVDLITYSRQDHSGWWYFWGADLRNDEGVRMEEGTYTPRRNERLTLYKNLGNGHFEMVQNTGLVESTSPDGQVSRAVSAGDYDNDGYIDLVVSGMYKDVAYESFVNEKHHSGRYVKLYHNRGKVADGEPQFEEMNIAETIGGVYTSQQYDDSNEPVGVPEKLNGYFAPISGNVQFADVNNDGWLDIVISGYGDIWDGVYNNGLLVRVYLNENGQKFVDVTNQTNLLEGANNGSIILNDFNKDGYLDFMTCGYSWNLNGWHNLMYLNDKGANVFSQFLDGDAVTGLPGSERNRLFASDFDGDGNLDVYYASGLGRATIFYGTQEGTRFEDDATDMSGWKNDGDHTGLVADFSGDGIADIYVPSERGWDGSQALADNPNPADIKINKQVVESVAVHATPTTVDYTVKDGKLIINWEYNTTEAVASNIAYNIYVKYKDGSVMTLVPADPATGFVKVAEGKQVALRPTITTHTITTSLEVSEVGVQAISLNNFTASPFAKGILTGIDNIADDDVEGETIYYNMQGMRIANPQNGQFLIKKQGNKVSKIYFE